LPGLGLLLAWLTLVALETHSTEAVLSPQPSVLSPAI
jgi:hypothetical protein